MGRSEARDPNPLATICPLCGALPGEACIVLGEPVDDFTHMARDDEAFRVAAARAEPTRPL